jgi:hypothetical protein
MCNASDFACTQIWSPCDVIELLQAFLALNASQLDTEKSELQKDRHAFKSAMEQYAATQNGGCGLQWRTAC